MLGTSKWKKFIRQPLAVCGLTAAVLLVIMAAAAPVCSTHDPTLNDLYNSFAAPSASHWFGTDSMGRDIYSRILYGGRATLGAAAAAVLAGGILGAIIGAVCGKLGGMAEKIIMFPLDILAAIPGILLVYIVKFGFTAMLANTPGMGMGIWTVIIPFAVCCVPKFARVLRDEITAGHNANHMIMHILACAASCMATCVFGVALFGYLGTGIQPPTPEWGAMFSEGRYYNADYPHVMAAPGIIIVLSIVAFNLLGDGLKKAADGE